ncbi:abscisic acid 8'-hydroxylase 2 isoform X2 [Ananas comosus]|uniref:Abscisic acid 8'-hydroxylase 2 isoform X2 n=1 Tax=Ananas comosus TaxID=4615 RepID=A0A6P5FLS3_ANACO|nr:abscisic acid 8'-hydroxylase 2 isoform X2 [Ananas comosus]
MMMMMFLHFSLQFLLHPLLHFLFITLITCLALKILKSLTTTTTTTTTTIHRSRVISNYPPGSDGFPLIGETLAFIAAHNSSKGFYDFVRTRHLRYGNCFKTNLFGGTHVFVSSVEVAKALLGSESVDFPKRYIKTVATLLGEESLLCSSHEHHKFLRRQIASLFTLDHLSSSVRMFDELTVETMRVWKEKRCVIVLDYALKITFNAICKMLLSLEDDNEMEALRNDVSEVTEALLAFPLRFPGTRFNRGLKARERIMDTLREKMAMRRNGVECKNDFLEHLLAKDNPDSAESLTDQQISDNILTLIIAGQVTTASAITWMVKYLDENKEVQDKLRLEIALKNSDTPLRLETLNDMHYASKIVKESLRMATVVSWFPRVALKDCQLGGFQIRKDWIVNVNARSAHYDSTIYDEPMKFDPSRFDEDPKPYSFLAFGAGGRTCLGMNLAKEMMLVFLHHLVTTCRWEVTDADPSLEKWAMFPRLRSGCPIRVIPIN